PPWRPHEGPSFTLSGTERGPGGEDQTATQNRGGEDRRPHVAALGALLQTRQSGADRARRRSVRDEAPALRARALLGACDGARGPVARGSRARPRRRTGVAR